MDTIVRSGAAFDGHNEHAGVTNTVSAMVAQLLAVPPVHHEAMPGAQIPAARGSRIGRLGKWLRNLRTPLADDLGVTFQLARIGVWRQGAKSDRVELTAELRKLLCVRARATSETAALAALHPDDREAARALLRRARVTLEPVTQELRVQHPHGVVRHTRWEVRVAADRQGRPRSLTALVQDITDWRMAEERRRQASRMDALGQLAAGLAHDFNNLLHTVVLNLEMLQEGIGRPSVDGRAHELLQRARGATGRGAELTAQLLAFAGKHPAECAPIDLFQLVQQSICAPATGAAFDNRGVSVELQDAPPVQDGGAAFVVEADPMLLRASLQTLLARARAASPDHGIVEVMVTRVRLDAAAAAIMAVRPGHYVEIAVSDRGEETPSELLPRLFEPFFRAEPDGTDPTAAGVGLAIVHGFARTHGGAVALERTAGYGTTARLLLPMASEAVRRALRDRATQPPRPERAAPFNDDMPELPLDGLRVLLVEDDPEVRDTTAMLLVDDGADVTTADDGPSALALLAGPQPFDLLLSDVVLPGGLSGIDVVERAAHLRPGLPALLASGYAAPAQELGRPLPADVILLRKPYRHVDLLAAIAATLPAAAHRRDAA